VKFIVCPKFERTIGRLQKKGSKLFDDSTMLKINVFIFMLVTTNIFYPEVVERTNAKLHFLSQLVQDCRIIPFHMASSRKRLNFYARRAVMKITRFI
jgi:hypothetical protein